MNEVGAGGFADGPIDGDVPAHELDELTGDAMFSGWGVRTLSADEIGYNPLDY